MRLGQLKQLRRLLKRNEFIQPKVEAKDDDLEIVRARDENGHFIADNPDTPDVNEAWVVKTVKKATKKK